MIILNYFFQDVTVETPQGHSYVGKKHVYSDVSIYLNFNEIFDLDMFRFVVYPSFELVNV